MFTLRLDDQDMRKVILIQNYRQQHRFQRELWRLAGMRRRSRRRQALERLLWSLHLLAR